MVIDTGQPWRIGFSTDGTSNRLKLQLLCFRKHNWYYQSRRLWNRVNGEGEDAALIWQDSRSLKGPKHCSRGVSPLWLPRGPLDLIFLLFFQTYRPSGFLVFALVLSKQDSRRLWLRCILRSIVNADDGSEANEILISWRNIARRFVRTCSRALTHHPPQHHHKPSPPPSRLFFFFLYIFTIYYRYPHHHPHHHHRARSLFIYLYIYVSPPPFPPPSLPPIELEPAPSTRIDVWFNLSEVQRSRFAVVIKTTFWKLSKFFRAGTMGLGRNCPCCILSKSLRTTWHVSLGQNCPSIAAPDSFVFPQEIVQHQDVRMLWSSCLSGCRLSLHGGRRLQGYHLMSWKGVFPKLFMDGGGNLTIFIEAFLILWPKAVIIWFDPRVVNSPKICSYGIFPAAAPAIDEIPMVVQA